MAFPPTAQAGPVAADAGRLLRTRGIRALADGLVAVVLPGYLLRRGLSPAQVGAVVTATVLGSAVITLAVGLRGGHLDRTRLLRWISALMVATGIAFGFVAPFPALLVVAVLGTINPSSGDVSAFLPVEQALLPDTVTELRRTHVFARYTLVAALAAAVGSLAAGLPEVVSERSDLSLLDAERLVFLLYAAAGVALLVQYGRLSSRPSPPRDRAQPGLGRSRAVVLRLAAVFSLDSFGSGFSVQSIIVLWLALRFEMSTAMAGAIFFWSGLLTACSALLAPRIAARIGLIRTMVFTHLPANALLIGAGLAPNATLAVACLLARSLLSQMDVPARTSYVMAVVEPHERPAAASVTNVPRSLASALPPLAAGWMLQHSTFGWPLILAGAIKIIYDLLLLALFHDLRPPEERVVPAGS